jgi:hypothetical protein
LRRVKDLGVALARRDDVEARGDAEGWDDLDLWDGADRDAAMAYQAYASEASSVRANLLAQRQAGQQMGNTTP